MKCKSLINSALFFVFLAMAAHADDSILTQNPAFLLFGNGQREIVEKRMIPLAGLEDSLNAAVIRFESDKKLSDGARVDLLAKAKAKLDKIESLKETLANAKGSAELLGTQLDHSMLSLLSISIAKLDAAVAGDLQRYSILNDVILTERLKASSNIQSDSVDRQFEDIQIASRTLDYTALKKYLEGLKNPSEATVYLGEGKSSITNTQGTRVSGLDAVMEKLSVANALIPEIDANLTNDKYDLSVYLEDENENKAKVIELRAKISNEAAQREAIQSTINQVIARTGRYYTDILNRQAFLEMKFINESLGRSLRVIEEDKTYVLFEKVWESRFHAIDPFVKNYILVNAWSKGTELNLNEIKTNFLEISEAILKLSSNKTTETEAQTIMAQIAAKYLKP